MKSLSSPGEEVEEEEKEEEEEEAAERNVDKGDKNSATKMIVGVEAICQDDASERPEAAELNGKNSNEKRKLISNKKM